GGGEDSADRVGDLGADAVAGDEDYGMIAHVVDLQGSRRHESRSRTSGKASSRRPRRSAKIGGKMLSGSSRGKPRVGTGASGHRATATCADAARALEEETYDRSSAPRDDR